jgi:hypothetical protein
MTAEHPGKGVRWWLVPVTAVTVLVLCGLLLAGFELARVKNLDRLIVGVLTVVAGFALEFLVVRWLLARKARPEWTVVLRAALVLAVVVFFHVLFGGMFAGQLAGWEAQGAFWISALAAFSAGVVAVPAGFVILLVVVRARHRRSPRLTPAA